MDKGIKDHQPIDFSKLSEEKANALCQQYQIQLTPSERSHIQNHILKRPPTLAECLLWSIEGSEHCSYKSSKIHLKRLPTKAPNLMLAVGEDAGIVSIANSENGQHYGIAISHESHNHPSQIVPFEGAATGVGGNVRDISCMGAKVIAIADSLRFGQVSDNKTHWLKQGVVEGIASYGNALGLPNIAGDCYYHSDYQSNCLVTVIGLGLVEKSGIIHSYTPPESEGHQLILVGKPTDNSGFGGASFASIDLELEKANRGAIQEPNAFLERHLLKANEKLFELLKENNRITDVGFKDLGAGGIACAAVELAAHQGLGAKLQLENVHLGMNDINPTVILCAETQERFMWSVPKDLVPIILRHYNETFALPEVSSGARASVIGEITNAPQFVVTYHENVLVNVPSESVTSGLDIKRPYKARPNTKTKIDETPNIENLEKQLTTLLNDANIKTHKDIYQHYDKQVQGQTILERGKAASGVISPFNDDSYPKDIQNIGVSLSVHQNPFICQQSPYLGAQIAVIGALEKVISVGASPQAITDCLCFGSPENPYHMNDFVLSIDGIKDVCENTPLIEAPTHHLAIAAGNVSFYNQSQDDAIPPSPMISCLGKINDVKKVISASLKRSESHLYVLRGDYLSLAGSQFAHTFHKTKTFSTPTLDLKENAKRFLFMHQAINERLILSANPIHQGGLITTLCQQAIENQLGFHLNIESSENKTLFLFAETLGFVFEANAENEKALKILSEKHQLTIEKIGCTTSTAKISIDGEDIPLPL